MYCFEYDFQCEHCFEDLIGKPFKIKYLQPRDTLVLCIPCWKLALHPSWSEEKQCQICDKRSRCPLGRHVNCLVRSIARIAINKL